MSGGLVIQRPPDMDQDRYHQRASGPAMDTPSDMGWQSR